MNPIKNGPILEVTPQDVNKNLGDAKILDVRLKDEFHGELGHIDGAQLVPLGPDLEKFLAKTDRNLEIVFVCRSGNRSGHATLLAQQMGFKRVYNMQGGMVQWNILGLSKKY